MGRARGNINGSESGLRMRKPDPFATVLPPKHGLTGAQQKLQCAICAVREEVVLVACSDGRSLCPACLAKHNEVSARAFMFAHQAVVGDMQELSVTEKFDEYQRAHKAAIKTAAQLRKQIKESVSDFSNVQRHQELQAMYEIVMAQCQETRIRYLSRKDSNERLEYYLRDYFPGMQFPSFFQNARTLSWVDGPSPAEMQEAVRAFLPDEQKIELFQRPAMTVLTQYYIEDQEGKPAFIARDSLAHAKIYRTLNPDRGEAWMKVNVDIRGGLIYLGNENHYNPVEYKLADAIRKLAWHRSYNPQGDVILDKESEYSGMTPEQAYRYIYSTGEFAFLLEHFLISQSRL